MSKTTLQSSFPKIMGILNATPDSFSDGNNLNVNELVDKSLNMINQGADIIDIGGESTRPGADKVDVTNEINRVIPVLKALKREQNNALVSIDTSKVEVAQKALEEGADMINDVTGARDDEMVSLIGKNNCFYVCMHMQGNPDNMQENPSYNNVNREIIEYLSDKKEVLMDAGLAPEKLIWDPGIGFGKTLENNLSILSSLESYTKEHSTLLGVSRKSYIHKLCQNAEDSSKRLAGSLAPLAKAYDTGVEYLRVHDVYETKQFLVTYSNITK